MDVLEPELRHQALANRRLVLLLEPRRRNGKTRARVLGLDLDAIALRALAALAGLAALARSLVGAGLLFFGLSHSL